MKTIRFNRNEHYFMINRGDYYEFLGYGEINLKKNGYPTRKNYLTLNLNGLCDYGEDPVYELTYKRATKNFFWFTAEKLQNMVSNYF